MQPGGDTPENRPAPQNYTTTAVRLDGRPLPEDTPASWFVGVACRRCGTIYALEIAVRRDVHDLLASVEWVEAKMGLCGAHPELLIQQ